MRQRNKVQCVPQWPNMIREDMKLFQGCAHCTNSGVLHPRTFLLPPLPPPPKPATCITRQVRAVDRDQLLLLSILSAAMMLQYPSVHDKRISTGLSPA